VFGHTSIIATFYPFNFLLSDSVKRVVQTATVPSLYSAKGKFFFLIGPVASLHRHPRSSTEHSTCCHKICGVILQKTSGASDVAQTRCWSAAHVHRAPLPTQSAGHPQHMMVGSAAPAKQSAFQASLICQSCWIRRRSSTLKRPR